MSSYSDDLIQQIAESERQAEEGKTQLAEASQNLIEFISKRKEIEQEYQSCLKQWNSKIKELEDSLHEQSFVVPASVVDKEDKEGDEILARKNELHSDLTKFILKEMLLILNQDDSAGVILKIHDQRQLSTAGSEATFWRQKYEKSEGNIRPEEVEDLKKKSRLRNQETDAHLHVPKMLTLEKVKTQSQQDVEALFVEVEKIAIFVVDTNIAMERQGGIFITKLQELIEKYPHCRIRLAIPVTLVKELDKIKKEATKDGDLQKLLAAKIGSRKVNKILRNNYGTLIKEDPFEVVYVGDIINGYRVQTADDRILMFAYRLQKKEKASTVTILTEDINFGSLAVMLGLKTENIKSLTKMMVEAGLDELFGYPAEIFAPNADEQKDDADEIGQDEAGDDDDDDDGDRKSVDDNEIPEVASVASKRKSRLPEKKSKRQKGKYSQVIEMTVDSEREGDNFDETESRKVASTSERSQERRKLIRKKGAGNKKNESLSQSESAVDDDDDDDEADAGGELIPIASTSGKSQERRKFIPKGEEVNKKKGPMMYGCPGDSKTKLQFTVPRSMVALIIGKGGEMIKQIQDKSGSLVQFERKDDKGGPSQVCTITGKISGNHFAKSLIKELVECGTKSSPFLDTSDSSDDTV